MNKNYPSILYRTPDEWGEETVTDLKSVNDIIREMRHLSGGDWNDASPDDCDRFEFVEVRAGVAIYRRCDVRFDEFWSFRKAGDVYHPIKQAFEFSDLA